MTTVIRLNTDIEKRLDYLAKMTKRTKSFYIRKIIEDNLDDLEDIYLTESILENIKSGKEKILDYESVRKKYDLES